MDTTSWLRTVAALSFVSAVSLGGLGCAPEAPTDGESAEQATNESDALGASMKCDVSTLGGQACQDAIASVRSQAGAVGRSEIVERALNWVNLGIKYDDSKYFQGFRTDCSGFISMSWQYKSNPGTIAFPPFAKTTEYAFALGGFDDLAPGDAVNRITRIKNKKGNLVGHVMLFVGWASDDHQSMYLIHEYSPGKPTAIVEATRGSLSDYIAIRATNAPAPTSQGADPTSPPMEPVAPQTPGCGKLVANQSLGIDQGVTSCDGRFTLILQGDGNLVFYQNGSKALWSTSTFGSSVQSTVMQEDGNLVIYGPSGAIWSSKTDGNPGAWLALDDHGALVIDDANGKPIWWDGTGGL